MSKSSLQEFCNFELESYRKLNVNSKSLMFKEWFNNNSKLFTKVNKEKSLELSLKNNCKVRQCYKNTWLVSIVKRKMKYFEGLVVSENLPIPIDHSWLVDTDGQVIDPTLIITGQRLEKQLRKEYNITKENFDKNRLGDEYYGVEIPLDFVNKMCFKHKISGEWLTKFFVQELDQVGKESN